MKMSINNLQSIVLGREKDSGVKTIEIDCSEWKENFPQLTKYRIEVTSPNGIIYVRWIKAGRMTIEDVPERWREEVMKTLED